jgi:hypothetical protein
MSEAKCCIARKKEKQFDLSGFNKIIAGENFTVSVIKSKSYSINSNGRTGRSGGFGTYGK